MNNNNKHVFPDWALKCKRPGTELRFIRNNYYLYEVTSKYNKELKRSKKITGKILGKVTQHGFIESKARIRERDEINNINYSKVAIKDYGHISLLHNITKDIIEYLKFVFPQYWKSIFVLACARLYNQFPLKKIQLLYDSSYLSELFPNIACSPKSLSHILNEIGLHRDKIVNFFKNFINKQNSHYLIDITSFISKSKNLSLSQKGYNNKGFYDPQINLVMIFSPTIKMPVYYRILPGNIRDVSSFKLSLKESGINDSIIIADKGFYSAKNVENLEKEKMQFILPLRRNSSLIDYSNFKKQGKFNLKGHFKYGGKRIWFDEILLENKKIIIYLNDTLKSKEEEDYLDRIESCPENYTEEGFKAKEFKFGTFSLLTNLNLEAEEIYQNYKIRIEVEKMADVLKNTLDIDRSYMRNESSLEGWMFINHIASVMYYKLYNILLEKKLLSKYSPKDILDYLSSIKKIKINEKWENAEIPGKIKKIINILEISIT